MLQRMMRFWRRAFEARVLMVCSGNICRSPLAAATLRGQLAKAGLDRRVLVDSAGTHSLRGSPPDGRAVRAAARRGYDLAGGRARQVVAKDLERFDRVFAMDDANLGFLLGLKPAAPRGRPQRLLDLAPAADGSCEVPDPYYGPPDGFERVLDLVEPACEALVIELRQSLRGAA